MLKIHRIAHRLPLLVVQEAGCEEEVHVKVGAVLMVHVMLFHNRPVRAAMGSVIANGGVQLNRAQSLEGMFQSSQLYI